MSDALCTGEGLAPSGNLFALVVRIRVCPLTADNWPRCIMRTEACPLTADHWPRYIMRTGACPLTAGQLALSVRVCALTIDRPASWDQLALWPSRFVVALSSATQTNFFHCLQLAEGSQYCHQLCAALYISFCHLQTVCEARLASSNTGSGCEGVLSGHLLQKAVLSCC